MMPQQSAHLTEEALNDVLIGVSAPEAEAHLAECKDCRGQLAEFRSTLNLFNQATLAWSESRTKKKIYFNDAKKVRRLLLVPAGLALAAVLLFAIGVPLWRHTHPSPAEGMAVPIAAPEVTEAQIAQDNEMLQSVNAALSSDAALPVSEYHLLYGPHRRLHTRPESRNR